jgi:hypothetical protein
LNGYVYQGVKSYFEKPEFDTSIFEISGEEQKMGKKINFV